ncbi:MAG: glutaredoxin family protein [Lysobacter sp.]|nr:glutaredoxin family protein [Lysobacter sp.]
MTKPRLILYQRDDCHLCDLALEVMATARAPEFESVFIDEDQALELRFGVRVPVLRDDSRGTELDWPFDSATLIRFLDPTLPR